MKKPSEHNRFLWIALPVTAVAFFCFATLLFRLPAIRLNCAQSAFESGAYARTVRLLKNDRSAEAAALTDAARLALAKDALLSGDEAAAKAIVSELPVKLSRHSDTVSIVPARDLVSYRPKSIDVQKDVTFVYTWEVKELRAHVKLSQKVGEVEAYLGKTLLDKTDLVTNYTVSTSLISELFEYTKYIFLHPITLSLIAALIAFSILRLLRGARMASAIKAGKFTVDAQDADHRKEEPPQGEQS